MNAPTIPTMTLPARPNPLPLEISPAHQPASPPITRNMMMFPIVMELGGRRPGGSFRRGGRRELHLCHDLHQALAQDRVLVLRLLVVVRPLGDLFSQLGAHEDDEPVLDEDHIAPLRH